MTTPHGDDVHAARAVRPWYKTVSLLLATVAACELIAAAVATLARGQRIWELWLLPVGWVFFYALTRAIAGIVGQLDPKDPTVANFPVMPGDLMTVRRPRFVASLVLLVFPGAMVLMSAVALYGALTGQIHP